VLPTKFQLIWPNGFREDFLKMANNKQELHMAAILLLVVRSTHNMEICAGSPILLSYKATIHCTSKFQRRFLKIEATRVKICKINQPEKSIAYIWWPCLLTDRDEMSNLYRGHSIDVSYQDLVHFAKRFQRRFKCEKLRLWTPSDNKGSQRIPYS
jgi:hypothetical protein